MEAADRKVISIREVFQEISESISRYGYRPKPQDMVAIRECMFELGKWPALELTTGGVLGWMLGSLVRRRVPAACVGMFICYGQIDRNPAEEFCLHRVMQLPTPLGAEATAIVRGKDENSPHLRFLSELTAQSDRISKVRKTDSSAQPDWPQQQDSISSHSKHLFNQNADNASNQGEPVWQTTDPFDLCIDDAAVQQPSSATVNPKLQPEERRRKRQEAYRMQREARKQQRRGDLLPDSDHDDIFRDSPR